MSTEPITSPIEDSVPKVSEEVAVGEDLQFQRRWWRFERIAWTVLMALLLCDVLGLFGRGWLAKAEQRTPDGALTLKYERVARASTPSIMTLEFGSSAIRDGRIVVFVSDSVVKPLGAQRIAPQPAMSNVGDGGVTYAFLASKPPATVQIALEPSFPGYHRFRIQTQGGAPIDASIFVMP